MWDHARNDDRPYLEVDILGAKFLGLLASGASRTIIGSSGMPILHSLGVNILPPDVVACTSACGSSCRVSGVCSLPICLRGRVCVVDVLIVSDLPHLLILSWDFWKRIGIVAVVEEWHFMNQLPNVYTLEMDKTETYLSREEQRRLQEVVDRNVAPMGPTLGCTTVAEHVIQTDSAPIKQRYYRVSPVMQVVDRELQDMLARGIIEKSDSPWASPLIMVKKKDGTYRPCVDFRKLNSVTKKDSYPLPMVTDTLDKLRNA